MTSRPPGNHEQPSSVGVLAPDQSANVEGDARLALGHAASSDRSPHYVWVQWLRAAGLDTPGVTPPVG